MFGKVDFKENRKKMRENDKGKFYGGYLVKRRRGKRNSGGPGVFIQYPLENWEGKGGGGRKYVHLG